MKPLALACVFMLLDGCTKCEDYRYVEFDIPGVSVRRGPPPDEVRLQYGQDIPNEYSLSGRSSALALRMGKATLLPGFEIEASSSATEVAPAMPDSCIDWLRIGDTWHARVDSAACPSGGTVKLTVVTTGNTWVESWAYRIVENGSVCVQDGP